MKRNILLQFEDEDDYADVLVAIRTANGSSTKDPAERAQAIALICRGPWGVLGNSRPSNGAPLPGQKSLPIMHDPD
jgi:hypothetical protein